MSKTAALSSLKETDQPWAVHHDPERFARVAELHRKAFAWEPQGWIPLGIHVVDPAHSADLSYDNWLDPATMFGIQCHVLHDTLTVGSDLLPSMPLNHLGCAPLASMFGAKLIMPDEAGATFQDVGPTPLPILCDIADVNELAMPAMDAGILPAVERIMVYYRQHLPSWIDVVPPMPSGPFSTAMQLRGSELLIELVDRPTECAKLIRMCAEAEANSSRYLHRRMGAQMDRLITNFGILGTGLRLGEDSMVNLSPEMIHAFCLPAFEAVNDICGGRGHVHFCSLVERRHEHIYTALADTDSVAVISSQFGFEYYQQHVDVLRGRLAVESFYGDALAHCIGEHGSFEQWAGGFVPRFKNESGLVLYMQVASVEEGQRYWQAWQDAHTLPQR